MNRSRPAIVFERCDGCGEIVVSDGADRSRHMDESEALDLCAYMARSDPLGVGVLTSQLRDLLVSQRTPADA